MHDFYIFVIPVYRCEEDPYYADTKRRIAKRLEFMRSSSGIPRERAPESYRSAEESFRACVDVPWEFNEVVGWVKLYIEGSHVGGHLWWVKSKRLQRGMRKTFFLTTSSNILGSHFSPDDESDKIFKETLAQVEHLGRQKDFKGRYIDLRYFRNLGPFINWRALLDTAPSRWSVRQIG